MYALKEVSLSYNKLQALPSDLCWLTNLTDIRVDHNDMLEVPPRDVICKGALVILDYLKKLNRAKWTGKLDLSCNGLTYLPLEVLRMSNLTHLKLFKNHLTNLPSAFGGLVKLTSLSVIDNKLTLLPPEMGNLLQLKKLRISYNQFAKLTPVIGALTKLEAFKADNNKIQALIPEIGNLTRLKKLWLHKNKLLVLPPIISHLQFCKVPLEQVLGGRDVWDMYVHIFMYVKYTCTF